MVGHCPLEASIGVRVPDPQQTAKKSPQGDFLFAVASGSGTRKTEAAKPTSVCGGRGRVGVADTLAFDGLRVKRLSDL